LQPDSKWVCLYILQALLLKPREDG
jgi:hypothetical protein